MNEQFSQGRNDIEARVDSALNKHSERKRLKEKRERGIIEKAVSNLAAIRHELEENPSIQTYLETSRRSITLVRRTGIRTLGAYYYQMPFPDWREILLTPSGPVYTHDLYERTAVSPDLIRQLWDSNTDRRIVRGLAGLNDKKIHRKVARSIR